MSSFSIRDNLTRKGFIVRMVDTLVTGKDIYQDLFTASEGSGIWLVVTDHSDYRKIDLVRLKDIMIENPLIIDTGGMINRDTLYKHGFEYHWLGRL